MVKDEAVKIYGAALKAADPFNAVARRLRMEGSTLCADGARYDLDAIERVVVVGAGKGTALMAKAVEEVLGERIERGLVIVKYGHTAPLSRIEQVEAAHPLPDQAGVEGTERIVELVEGADESTLVICLLSGGASSLLVAPMEGICLEEKRATTAALLRAGAAIDELNAVRKHLSRTKGGRLARLASPAGLLTLILSDVIGDRLDVIASGPTAPDTATFRDALDVIDRYGLTGTLPSAVIKTLEDGLAGRVEETPKGSEAFFKKVRNIVVGGLNDSLDVAKGFAAACGFEAEVLTSTLHGEARDAAAGLAKKALERRASMRSGQASACLISGGETTVTVRGGGRGGRNQELALAFAIEIEGVDGVAMLSAGTDGTDGPTDAAGAIVDGSTAAMARDNGIDPKAYLEDNDSYGFFERLDSASMVKSHLKTGPTGTNVMDIQIIMLENAG